MPLPSDEPFVCPSPHLWPSALETRTTKVGSTLFLPYVRPSPQLPSTPSCQQPYCRSFQLWVDDYTSLQAPLIVPTLTGLNVIFPTNILSTKSVYSPGLKRFPVSSLFVIRPLSPSCEFGLHWSARTLVSVFLLSHKTSFPSDRFSLFYFLPLTCWFNPWLLELQVLGGIVYILYRIFRSFDSSLYQAPTLSFLLLFGDVGMVHKNLSPFLSLFLEKAFLFPYGVSSPLSVFQPFLVIPSPEPTCSPLFCAPQYRLPGVPGTSCCLLSRSFPPVLSERKLSFPFSTSPVFSPHYYLVWCIRPSLLFVAFFKPTGEFSLPLVTFQ